ncbi:glycosyltransferase family 39 protein [Methanosarcina sp. Mfa9]|uniref:glycosyltransferase family 39 protein n=1 Tax=Methanosarcina sp. Mfa9 TaxID=3439063 RepID=UPI003F841AFE
MNTFESYLVFATILFGFFTLYLYRNDIEIIENKIYMEKENEKKAEAKREQEFDRKFPFSAKLNLDYGISEYWKKGNRSASLFRLLIAPFIWIVRLPYSSVRWMYREGGVYTLIFIAILFLFTAIKAPYFDVSFTGEHTMKYNAYVEPAKYMYENHNPFLYRKSYQADPVNNPLGIFNTFSQLPLLEWGLAATYTLMPFNSLEVNTRLFTHFIGILILISAYVFFKNWFSKEESLIIIFLMAINPIISFTTFVTVADSLLLLLTFISLNYASKYIEEERIKHLFFAGLFFGIGVATKYSIILWEAPIFTMLLILNKKTDMCTFVKSVGIFGLMGVLPAIAFKTSLKYLPTDALLSTISFIIWIVIISCVYTTIIKKENNIDNIISKATQNKLLFVGAIISGISIGITFLCVTQAYRLFHEFLTDPKLIFNWDMYAYMLNKQFKEYMTENVFYLGLVGFIFSLYSGFSKQKIALITFLVGSFFYWILASKVIFFHNYYTNIIIIVFCISIGSMIYRVSRFYDNKFFFISIILVFSLLVYPTSYNANVNRLNEEIDQYSLMQVAQYLLENTNENEIYIDDSYILTLTILTGRPRIDESNLIQDEISESIKTIGFSESMKKYNISCVITTRNTPRYERYVNIFTDENLGSVSYGRRDIILSRLNPDYHSSGDIERRNQLIKECNIQNKFILEQKLGPYRIFSFAG